MILNPAIIALVFGSLLVSAVMIYASAVGINIINNWDLKSGSEKQLRLERKTYLLSSVLSYVLAFQFISLFLFVYTADDIHTLFIGAMCAAGSLNVNDYGYSTLFLKIVTVILCGIWIIFNHTDNKGYDYPLIKTKYKFLLLITALIIVESIFQFNYFFQMRPNIITSCCGTLFSEEAKSIAGTMAHYPPYWTMIVFFASLILTLRFGIHFLWTGRGDRGFSYLSVFMLLVAFTSIISFISVYFYELPTHHCPFCILQKEYGYIGYPLYMSLFTAGITGASVGVIGRYRGYSSLKEIIPSLQKRLCLVSMIGYAVFALIASYPIIFSDFILIYSD